MVQDVDHRKMLVEAFIDDLEAIKALLEEYRVGEALNYISARLRDYIEELKHN
jgi:hypothetical protein